VGSGGKRPSAAFRERTLGGRPILVRTATPAGCGDTSVIDRRIADKGPLLDGFPGLAYLVAQRAERGPSR